MKETGDTMLRTSGWQNSDGFVDTYSSTQEIGELREKVTRKLYSQEMRDFYKQGWATWPIFIEITIRKSSKNDEEKTNAAPRYNQPIAQTRV